MMQFPQVRPAVRPAVRDALTPDITTPQTVIAGLFAQGQQGFWLPFTDFASLTQDAAGTLPYTALEQPVGRVLDRSGRGNHASQATSTARGIVSARVNLLNNSEMLGSVAGAPGSPPTSWGTHIFVGGGVQMLEGLKPRFVATGGRATIKGVVVWQPNVVYEVSVKLENHQATAISPANIVLIGTVTATGQSTQIYVNGVLGAAIPPGVSTVRITTSYTGGTALNYLYLGAGASGTATADVTIFSADVRFATKASIPYQRVTTSTDYDSVGFPKYLCLDGVDDFYTCGGGGSTTGFYYSDVIQLAGAASSGIFQDAVSNKGYIFTVTGGALKLKMYAGNGTSYTTFDSTTSLVIGQKHFVEFYDDGVNLGIAIDGGTPTTIPRPAVQGGLPTIQLFKVTGVPTFNGQITEPIYRAGPPPSAYEREVIRNYQMQKAGMA